MSDAGKQRYIMFIKLLKKINAIMVLVLLVSCNKQSNAQLNNPYSITVDSSGNIYVLDCTSVIRKINKNGVKTILGKHGVRSDDEIVQILSLNPESLIAAHRTYIELISSNGERKLIAGDKKFRGYSEANGEEARFSWIGQMVLTSYDSIIVIDFGNRAIREIWLDGKNRTICKDIIKLDNNIPIEFNPELLAIDKRTNDLFIDDGKLNSIFKWNKATGIFYHIISHPKDSQGYTQKGIIKPYNLIVASDQNLLIGGYGVIVKVNKNDVETLSGRQGEIDYRNGDRKNARFGGIIDLCFDNNNELLVLDSHTLRRIDKDGNITTVIGKPGDPGCWEK